MCRRRKAVTLKWWNMRTQVKAKSFPTLVICAQNSGSYFCSSTNFFHRVLQYCGNIDVIHHYELEKVLLKDFV